MSKPQMPIVAALFLGCLACRADGQVDTLYNPGFEIRNLQFQLSSFADGWRHHQAGQSVRRWIGLDEDGNPDPGTPPTQVHSGNASILLPGGAAMTINNYQAVQSEDPPGDIFPPVYNWPRYTFDVDPDTTVPITVSCWFMIPSDAPMVGSRFGLKVAFLRGAADGYSYYVYFDRLSIADDPTNVDPDTTLAPFPGCTIVMRPEDGLRKGIHTNNQWLKISHTFNQTVDFIDQAAMPPAPFPNPPSSAPNGAFASVFAARFGPDTHDSLGIVWVDDFEFVQGEPCAADFDGDGTVAIGDIFAMLAAWFAGDPGTDFNNSGGADVGDIFAFLSIWFVGCP